MTSAHGSERWSKVVRSDLYDAENIVFTDEKGLGLSLIQYEIFERGIKRFGYVMDLSDECLEASK